MKVTQTMQVSAERFSQFIHESVLSDIFQATGKKMQLDEIPVNFQYQKTLKNRMGKEGLVQTSIDELTLHSYKASFISAQGINTLCYEWHPIDADSIEVTYEEEYIANSKANALNYRIMNFLYKKNNLKRIKSVLNQMASTLETQKKSA